MDKVSANIVVILAQGLREMEPLLVDIPRTSKYGAAAGIYDEINKQHFRQRDGSWHLYTRVKDIPTNWFLSDREPSEGRFKIMSNSKGGRPEDVTVWNVYSKGEVKRDSSIKISRKRKRDVAAEVVKRRRVDAPVVCEEDDASAAKRRRVDASVVCEVDDSSVAERQGVDASAVCDTEETSWQGWAVEKAFHLDDGNFDFFRGLPLVQL